MKQLDACHPKAIAASIEYTKWHPQWLLEIKQLQKDLKWKDTLMKAFIMALKTAHKSHVIHIISTLKRNAGSVPPKIHIVSVHTKTLLRAYIM